MAPRDTERSLSAVVDWCAVAQNTRPHPRRHVAPSGCHTRGIPTYTSPFACPFLFRPFSYPFSFSILIEISATWHVGPISIMTLSLGPCDVSLPLSLHRFSRSPTSTLLRWLLLWRCFRVNNHTLSPFLPLTT